MALAEIFTNNLDKACAWVIISITEVAKPDFVGIGNISFFTKVLLQN